MMSYAASVFMLLGWAALLVGVIFGGGYRMNIWWEGGRFWPKIFVLGGWHQNKSFDFFNGPWPVNWRRLFLITLPVSGPLWAATCIVFVLGTMALMVVLLPCWAIGSFWSNE